MYSSISELKYPERFPFQKNVTWPNLTVSLQKYQEDQVSQHNAEKKLEQVLPNIYANKKPQGSFGKLDKPCARGGGGFGNFGKQINL